MSLTYALVCVQTSGHRGKLERRERKCLGLAGTEGAVDNKRCHWPTVVSQSVVDNLQLVFIQSPRLTAAKH